MHSKDFQFKFVAQLQQHPHVPENALVRLVLLVVFAPEVLIEQFDFFAAPVFFNPLRVSKHFQVFVILKIKFLVDAGLCEIVFLFQCLRFK